MLQFRSLCALKSQRQRDVIVRLLFRRTYASSSGGSDEIGGLKSTTVEETKLKKKLANELDIDADELSRKLHESLNDSEAGRETPVDKEFMNFKSLAEKEQHKNSSIFTWKTELITLAITGSTLIVLLYLRKLRNDERENNRKRMIGKANIGGEWELMDVNGKPRSSRDLHGKWVLIYFGFTNCPDICPEEIEKMIDVVDQLDRDEDALPIVPVFISVDPVRDTPERVRKYCAEFSPKLQGFTGSPEQVEKVSKAFRVYRSEGPKRADADDYIVDHTVIMYLIDPDGQFHDYYGQNRRALEVANAIRLKAIKYDQAKHSSWF